jgi:hypothetical protein
MCALLRNEVFRQGHPEWNIGRQGVQHDDVQDRQFAAVLLGELRRCPQCDGGRLGEVVRDQDALKDVAWHRIPLSTL